MSFAVLIDGAWVESGDQVVDVLGRTIPPGWVAGLEPDERAALGWVEVADVAAPTGLEVIVTGKTVVDVAGVPTRAWTTQAVSAADQKALLETYAMAARWTCEQAGLLFDGHPLPTDASGQAYIAGAHQAAMADATITKQWQVGNAPIAFVTFSNAQLRALGLALDALVQSTFDALATVAADIEAGSVTTMAAVDAAFAAVGRVFTAS